MFYKIMFNFLFLMLLFLSAASAQTQQFYRDVIYLKNGTIVKGLLIEEVPFKSVMILTELKELLVFKFEEIEKFGKEVYNISEPQGLIPTNTKKSVEQEEFFDSSIINVLSSFAYKKGVPNVLKLDGILNKNISKDFYFGFGAHLDYAAKNFFTGPLINTGFRATYFSYKGFTPVITNQFGYSFLLNRAFKPSGVVFSNRIGFKKTIYPNLDIEYTMGYNFIYDNIYRDSYERYHIDGVAFALSVFFN